MRRGARREPEGGPHTAQSSRTPLRGDRPLERSATRAAHQTDVSLALLLRDMSGSARIKFSIPLAHSKYISLRVRDGKAGAEPGGGALFPHLIAEIGLDPLLWGRTIILTVHWLYGFGKLLSALSGSRFFPLHF